MPSIIVEAFEGRTLDQRRELAKGITEVVARVYKVQPEAVRIKFVEQKRQDVAHAGVLVCDQ
jgi:4-oxalocrotonate tautomerase